MDAPQCPVTGCRGGPDTSLEGASVGGGLVPSGLFAPLARGGRSPCGPAGAQNVSFSSRLFWMVPLAICRMDSTMAFAASFPS